MSDLDEIEKLHSLYSKGIITLEEFNREKKKILEKKNISFLSSNQNQTKDFFSFLESLLQEFNGLNPKTKRYILIGGGIFLFLIIVNGMIKNENRKRNLMAV